MLSQAWERYRDHEERGDDMVQAGAELADAVMNIAAGPTCGPPREELLRLKESLDLEEPGVPVDDLEQPEGYRR